MEAGGKFDSGIEKRCAGIWIMRRTDVATYKRGLPDMDGAAIWGREAVNIGLTGANGQVGFEGCGVRCAVGASDRT